MDTSIIEKSITIIAGLPASGKTTYANRHFIRPLEYDSFLAALGSSLDLQEEQDLIYRQFKLKASSGNYDAVVDVFETVESRRFILSALSCKPDLVIVSCPLEECLKRNSLRIKSKLSNDEIIGLYCAFEPVSIDEGFNSIKIYDSVANRYIGGSDENF